MDRKIETEVLQTPGEYLRAIIVHISEHLARLEQEHSAAECAVGRGSRRTPQESAICPNAPTAQAQRGKEI
jgi:hypothetical protein